MCSDCQSSTLESSISEIVHFSLITCLVIVRTFSQLLRGVSMVVRIDQMFLEIRYTKGNVEISVMISADMLELQPQP
jgi:hypothetical protein